MRTVLAAIGTTLFTGAAAMAGTIRDDVSPQAYLNLGARSAYASVGRLITGQSNGSLTSSGTLIAPDVVLIAAHSLTNATSLNFLVGGSNYTATQWTAFPLWAGDLYAGYDIGLVKLSSPVLNVVPADRYHGASEVGQLVTEVGYGMTGTGLTGETRFDGQKRAGTNVVDNTTAGSGASARLLWSDFDRPGTSGSRLGGSGATALEYLIGRGDSGGGLFMDTTSGAKLMGVASFGYSTDGNVDASYGEKAGFTRVSAFNSWIDTMLRQFSVLNSFKPISLLSGVRANDLAIEVPEPSSAVLLVLGLIGLMCARRQR